MCVLAGGSLGTGILNDKVLNYILSFLSGAGLQRDIPVAGWHAQYLCGAKRWKLCNWFATLLRVVVPLLELIIPFPGPRVGVRPWVKTVA